MSNSHRPSIHPSHGSSYAKSFGPKRYYIWEVPLDAPWILADGTWNMQGRWRFDGLWNFNP